MPSPAEASPRRPAREVRGVGRWCRLFFFQAEDGIRDLTVTGVQTCALPISSQAQAPQSSPSPQVQAGQTLFSAQCAFCHGRDAAGGETGPDLTSSETVEKDVGGNEIGSVVRTGRPDRGMPQFNLTDTDLAAIVAFLHDEKAKAESKPGRRRNVQPEDLQTGNAEEGQDYFNGAGGCSRCHSPTGDLAGVANRLRGLALLQRMLYPKPRKSGPADSPAAVTVTLATGQTVTGKLAYQDEFVIGLTDSRSEERRVGKECRSRWSP